MFKSVFKEESLYCDAVTTIFYDFTYIYIYITFL